MNDLTEARPTTSTVTAEEILKLGYDQGRADEREAILRTINAMQVVHDPATADVLWTIVRIIKAGGHYQNLTP